MAWTHPVLKPSDWAKDICSTRMIPKPLKTGEWNFRRLAKAPAAENPVIYADRKVVTGRTGRRSMQFDGVDDRPIINRDMGIYLFPCSTA